MKNFILNAMIDEVHISQAMTHGSLFLFHLERRLWLGLCF